MATRSVFTHNSSTAEQELISSLVKESIQVVGFDAMYLPRLQRLNLYGTSVTNKGLIYLLDLQELRSLHLFGTKVTWSGANEFIGKMEAISGNDDLEITTGYNNPSLGSFKHNEFLKSSYQKNVDLGRLDPNYVDKYPAVKADKKSAEEYEEEETP